MRFASGEGVCETAEGPVRYLAGDAIAIGSLGEEWPVKADQFAAKYRPSSGTKAGEDGDYLKRSALVQASRLDTPSKVTLADGSGELAGQSGDWHVRYCDGTESIVGAAYFEALYEPARIALLFRSDAALEANLGALKRLEGLCADLRSALPNTSVRWLRSTDEPDAPTWFVTTAKGAHRHLHFDNTLKLPLNALSGDSQDGQLLVAHIERLKRPSNVLLFTWDRVRTLVRLLGSIIADQPEEESDPERDAEDLVPVLAKQLVSLDLFNESIRRADAGERAYAPAPNQYQQPLDVLCAESAPSPADAALLARFLAIGAVADCRANHWQALWQWRMLGPTDRLSGYRYIMNTDTSMPGWAEPKHIERQPDGRWWLFGRAALPISLFTLGLLAAVLFTLFTELSDGCPEKGNEIFRVFRCQDAGWHMVAGKSLLGAYLACMAVGWLVFAYTQVHQLKRRHQDCRMLAECLRVHYALIAACVPTSTGEDIPISGPATSNWVVQALRALIYQYARQPAGTATRQSLQQAQVHFVRAQIVYHRRTLIGRRHLALRRFRQLGDVGVIAAVAALVLLVLDSFVLSEEHALPSFGHHLVVVAMLGGLAVWAALRRVAEAYGWEAEARRGALVLNALRHAEHALQHGSSLASMLHELQHCGRLFVADQAAWHNLHRARPIEAASGA